MHNKQTRVSLTTYLSHHMMSPPADQTTTTTSTYTPAAGKYTADISTARKTTPAAPPQEPSPIFIKCPRCDSTNTKFCYYNNYRVTQPRYFCKTCRRYWTRGGALRHVPIGGGSRKNKKLINSSGGGGLKFFQGGLSPAMDFNANLFKQLIIPPSFGPGFGLHPAAGINYGTPPLLGFQEMMMGYNSNSNSNLATSMMNNTFVGDNLNYNIACPRIIDEDDNPIDLFQKLEDRYSRKYGGNYNNNTELVFDSCYETRCSGVADDRTPGTSSSSNNWSSGGGIQTWTTYD